MDVKQRLAKNLKRIREERKLSQETLAFEADIHRTYLSDIERGARNPTIVVVDRFAQALNVTLGELLD